MGRKVNQSTIDAYNLIGTIREDGKPHTAYSASKLVKANLRTVYKWAEKHKKPETTEFKQEAK